MQWIVVQAEFAEQSGGEYAPTWISFGGQPLGALKLDECVPPMENGEYASRILRIYINESVGD